MQETQTAANPARLPVGTVVDGRYEILAFMGQGGFARVYKARHVHMDDVVALKVLNSPPEDSPEAFEERFLLEAQIAASLKHPNIVAIRDFGFTDVGRRPYIAMELLTGHDLEEEISERGPMEVQRVQRLMVPCLEAIGQGHAKGIIHKDLKPANLFICDPDTDAERLVVLDFGVARLDSDEGKKMTKTGTFTGTPQYLSPEYIIDQTVTPALDVYQLGLILAEMLSGKAAVPHTSPYTCLMAHCSGDLDIPVFIRRGPLGQVLDGALVLDHGDRFNTATAFRDALAAVDLEAPSATATAADQRPPASSVRLPRTLSTSQKAQVARAAGYIRGHRGVVAGIGAGLLGLVLVLMVVTTLVVAFSKNDESDPEADQERTDALAEALRREPDNAELQDQLAEAKRHAADQRIFDEAVAALEDGLNDEALDAFEQLSDPSPQRERARDEGLLDRAQDGAIRNHLRQARNLIVLKEWGPAKRHIERVLELDPNNRDAKQYLKEIKAHRPATSRRFGPR